MKIAKQGWKFIAAGAAVEALGIGGFIAGFLRQRPVLLVCGGLLLALGSALTAFMAYFFRDPERPLPADSSKIWSPGDGRVISVAREGSGENYTIRIFLSPLDVHVQRAPVSGRVVSKDYREGSFAAAMKKEAQANERCVLAIEPEGRERLVCEQITGFLVRRIETWPEAGSVVKAGERYGIMYFGSQCAVHLPVSARALVQVNDRVVGGVTPIAEWTS